MTRVRPVVSEPESLQDVTPSLADSGRNEYLRPTNRNIPVDVTPGGDPQICGPEEWPAVAMSTCPSTRPIRRLLADVPDRPKASGMRSRAGTST